MSGSAMENEPEENLADSFEHWPNEPATRNDLRILATLVDRRFNKVDLQFQTMQTMFKEEMFEFRESMRKEMFEFRESMRKDMSDFKDMMRKETGDSKESMRKDMYKFAGFLTVTVISAIGVFGAFVR
jgi:hypothetical protein